MLVTLTKAPQADLIKVVEANGLGYRIDETGIRNRRGNNVGEIQLEEVYIGDYCFWIGIPNKNLMR